MTTILAIGSVRRTVDEERDDVPPALRHHVAAVPELPREGHHAAGVGVQDVPREGDLRRERSVCPSIIRYPRGTLA